MEIPTGTCLYIKITWRLTWCRRLTENFQVNKKMFWKEVKRTQKGTSGKEERVKTENGRLLIEKDAVRKRWAEYFERLLNAEEDREPEIVAVGRVRNECVRRVK